MRQSLCVWPAFSPSGDAEPFSAGKANACLNALLHMVMTPIEATKRSWHSCRVTLATRLFAKRDNEIKRDEVVEANKGARRGHL